MGGNVSFPISVTELGSTLDSPNMVSTIPLSTYRFFRAIFIEGHILLPHIVPKEITSVDYLSDGSFIYTFAEGMKVKVDVIDMKNLTCKCTSSDSNNEHDRTDFIVTNCKFEPNMHGGTLIKLSSTYEPKGDTFLAEERFQSRMKSIQEIFKVVSYYLAKNSDVCASVKTDVAQKTVAPEESPSSSASDSVRFFLETKEKSLNKGAVAESGLGADGKSARIQARSKKGQKDVASSPLAFAPSKGASLEEKCEYVCEVFKGLSSFFSEVVAGSSDANAKQQACNEPCMALLSQLDEEMEKVHKADIVEKHGLEKTDLSRVNADLKVDKGASEHLLKRHEDTITDLQMQLGLETLKVNRLEKQRSWALYGCILLASFLALFYLFAYARDPGLLQDFGVAAPSSLKDFCVAEIGSSLKESCVSADGNPNHSAFAAAPPPPPGPENYILAIQWAYTVCNGHPSCSSSNFQKEFTIHGLWRHPELLPAPGSFNPQELTSIKEKLDRDWINAKKKNDNNQFWKHEYEKHGLCTSFRPTKLYFSKALDAYGMLKSFGLGNFVVRLFAGKAVSEQIIYTQLKSHLNKDFAMICSKDGKSNLQELRLYFKYQVNTGARGWVLDNLPVAFQQRCPTGDIKLPLV